MAINVNYTEPRARAEATVIVLAAVALSVLILVPRAVVVVAAACISVLAVSAVIPVFAGDVSRLLLLWAAVFPLGYYFLSFPRERTLISLDRVVLFFLLLGLAFSPADEVTVTPRRLRHAALACLVFVGVGAASLYKTPDPLSSGRWLVEGFLMPVLLGWSIMARFDVRRHFAAIHTSTCICCVICATVAVGELVVGHDLLPLPGADFGIGRPNGPFSNNDSLALIGGVSLFFLLFLKAELGDVTTSRKLLHGVGLTAALGMTLMPMFRSVALTLFVILVIDAFWVKRAEHRLSRVLLLLFLFSVIFGLFKFTPETLQDRADPANFYARIAEYKQTMQVFSDHPILGVGFHNFHETVTDNPKYRNFYEGISSVDWPHSNLAAALSETGLLGFVPYVLANLLLVAAVRRLSRFSMSGFRAWRYYIYIFLMYWISGLTLTSGYYSWLNLWYVFVITVIFKYALTDPDLLSDVLDDHCHPLFHSGCAPQT